ncbi:MAG TPA: pitrilysin family protein [Flavobacteriales bacterium]
MKKILYISMAVALVAFSACKSKDNATSVATASKVDRSVAPAPGPAPSIKIGQYQLFQLENGMKVIVVENHKLPRVSYSINFKKDPIQQGDKAGYEELAGTMLQYGTKTKSKAEIDESVDYMGASLSTSSSRVSGSCLKKHNENFLALMSDVVLNPSFPQDEFDKLKKQQLSALASEKTSPNSISSKLANSLNYGRKHPYGEIVTEETVNNITRDDLVSYYNSYFKPNIATLIVVGDITAEEAKAQAEKYFGSWKPGNISPRTYQQPQAPAQNRVAFVPVTGAVQSVIDITYPIDLRPGTQDAIVASVLNNILGGSGFQTRLMQNLREDKAYTYGAYSSIDPDEYVGYFSASASVRNAVTDSAITQFLYEMQRLVEEPVDDATLQTVKNILTGSFSRSLERPQTIANFAYNIEKYNLPKDYYETYLQKLNAITPADIQALAKRIIKPNNAYITVVGNREVIPALEQFGKVEIYDEYGNPFVDLRPAPLGVTPKAVFENYIKAIGGKDVVTKLKSYEQEGTLTMAMIPAPLQVNIKMKDNSKIKMTMKMGAMELMTQKFDGKKGVISQMGQNQPMDEEDLADIKMQADYAAPLNYEKYGIKSELKGIGTVDKEEAYVIELTKPNGGITTEYYSLKSGLLLKSVSVSGGETPVTSETIYKSYATASNGMKYANHYSTTAEGQTMEFNITEMKVNPKLDDKEFAVE